MKKGVFIWVMLFFALAAKAQFPSEIWHDGEIVLTDGDTLKGLVKYNLETDIIQFSKDKKTIKTYTARKIVHFEIFDQTSDRYRNFYVLPYNLNGNYKAPIIFELIYEGSRMSMLSREAVEYEVTNYPYSVAGTYSRMVLVYTNYFLTSDGNIVKFSGKKKDLIHGPMSKRSTEIKKFLKTNNIRLDRRSDVVKVVAYYNSLFQDTANN